MAKTFIEILELKTHYNLFRFMMSHFCVFNPFGSLKTYGILLIIIGRRGTNDETNHFGII